MPRTMANEHKKAISILDRCGNNWKNGKGGCGILCAEESCQCLATMFQPFVLITSFKEDHDRKDNKVGMSETHRSPS